MAWLESHQELRDHPKTAALRRRLGIGLPQAVGHLHLLWWWALAYADDGDLAGYEADVLADAAGWEHEPGVFVRALIAAGFLDDNLRIHDWHDYAGRLVERRRADAERKKQARVSAGRPAAAPPDGAPTAPGVRRNTTQPDLTGHNRTGPDLPPDPPPHAEGGTTGTRNQRRSRTLRGEASPATALEVNREQAPRRRGKRAVPTDPAAYVSGEYGSVVAERMAAKLQEGES
jgi:hypothetical protein